MHVLMVTMLAVGAFVAELSDEPTEHAMRTAFEAHITSDVQAALDFAQEVGGPEAVAKIRAAGTDRFEIRTFQKLDCTRSETKPGYVCGFLVDIGMVGGDLQSVLLGRFFRGSNGLDFSLDS
jgi:hypothetical protein